MSEKLRVQIPEKLGFLFEPHRYKVTWGGRGAGKSWAYARAAIVHALRRRHRILCARELQKSIRESVHQLLRRQITSLGLDASFHVTNNSIRCITSGSEFIFSGLRSNASEIKSMEGVTIVWVEEAEAVSEQSWELLIPTIREDGAEIWVVFNPQEPTDATYRRFIENPPPNARVEKMLWRDNPWFPSTLRKEKDYDYANDPEAAEHVWGGVTRALNKAQVLNGKWIIEGFEPGPDWDGPFYGCDWGYAADPSALVRCWVYERRLYIEAEAYGVGVELEELPALFDTVPGASDHVIRADSARPDTISFMRRHGYPKIEAARKGPGSVEDGVAHLRKYEKIVIHPSCTHAKNEARLWSWKVDRLSGDVLPILIDKHNHCVVGDTEVETTDGPRKICELVGRTGALIAFDGDRALRARYRDVRETSTGESVYQLRLADGRSITATGEHPFITQRGWRPLLAIDPGDKVLCVSDALRYAEQPCQKNSSGSQASSSPATSEQVTTSTAPTTGGSENACTDPCGGTRTVLSPRECTCTTETGIEETTRSRISSCSVPETTSASIGKTQEENSAAQASALAGMAYRETSVSQSFAEIWRRPAPLLAHGMGAEKGERGIRSTPARSQTHSAHAHLCATGAEARISVSSRDVSARTLASLLREDPRMSMTFEGNALCVGLSSAPTDTRGSRRAAPTAGLSWVSVIAVDEGGEAPVFNLEVDGVHTFVVAGGIVTHNCIDSLRYALEPLIRARTNGTPRGMGELPTNEGMTP